MKQFEELFFKISDDFHNELNPILKALEPDIENHPHYIGKNALYKLYIIKDLLVSFNANDINRSHLDTLQQLLKTYKVKFESYFETYEIATGFVYTTPSPGRKEYFWNLDKYCFQFSYTSKSYGSYFLSLDIRGFPSDCMVKLRGVLHQNTIVVKLHRFPDSDQEQIKGERMYQISENQPSQLKPQDLTKNKENEIIKKFELFCAEVKTKNEEFFSHFEEIDQLFSHLESPKDVTYKWTADLYDKLIEFGYINSTLKNFQNIFEPSFNPEKMQKVEWLKSKFLLHFFISELNKKHLKIKGQNKWAEKRFYLKGITENRLANELSKATSNTKYWESIDGLNPDDPLKTLL